MATDMVVDLVVAHLATELIDLEEDASTLAQALHAEREVRTILLDQLRTAVRERDQARSDLRRYTRTQVGRRRWRRA